MTPATAANKQKDSAIKTTHTVQRIIAGALMSAGVAMAGIGMSAGTATAGTPPTGPFTWCPGDRP